MLGKIKRSDHGFLAVETIVAMFVVVVLGLAGWFVWHREHQAKKTAPSTSNSKAATTNATKLPVASDPYANWKSYCDVGVKACFRYPDNWTFQANADQVTVLNPGNNLEVDYIEPYAHDSGLLDFVPVSTADLATKRSDTKIVGGVYLPANEPDYAVVDASLLSKYPPTIKQQIQFPNALSFTDAQSSAGSAIAFRARATVRMATQADAQAWFNSADAETSLKILQSFNYQ